MPSPVSFTVAGVRGQTWTWRSYIVATLCDGRIAVTYRTDDLARARARFRREPLGDGKALISVITGGGTLEEMRLIPHSDVT